MRVSFKSKVCIDYWDQNTAYTFDASKFRVSKSLVGYSINLIPLNGDTVEYQRDKYPGADNDFKKTITETLSVKHILSFGFNNIAQRDQFFEIIEAASKGGKDEIINTAVVDED